MSKEFTATLINSYVKLYQAIHQKKYADIIGICQKKWAEAKADPALTPKSFMSPLQALQMKQKADAMTSYANLFNKGNNKKPPVGEHAQQQQVTEQASSAAAETNQIIPTDNAQDNERADVLTKKKQTRLTPALDKMTVELGTVAKEVKFLKGVMTCNHAVEFFLDVGPA